MKNKAISEVIQRGLPVTNASKALIILHGRGGTAEGMLDVADALCDDDFYILAPQAVNNVWYPYPFMEEDSKNEPFLSSSVQAIKELIDQTAQYIPQDHIYIAGFSQGACLTLEVTARSASKYGGIIAFTGGLIGKTLNEEKYQGNFAGTKTFIANGDNDPFIPLARSEESKMIFDKLGAQVTLKVYKGRPHTITEDELNFVKEKIMF